MIKQFFVSTLQKITVTLLSDLNKGALAQRATVISELQDRFKKEHPENPANHGYSVYSQNEEDGIIKRILEIIGTTNPSFIEFGVHLFENNTTNLLLNGGRGVWVDKGLTKFKVRCPSNSKLRVIDQFVTTANIYDICQETRKYLGIDSFSDLDFLSLDLDGNDFYLIAEILRKGVTPKVLCLEYNAKFPPPHKIKIKYNPNHTWTNNDDYFGCSLQEYVDLLLPSGYFLLACNITGSNCFFIRKDYCNLFKILDVAALYQPPRPFLSPFTKGGKSSDRHLLALLEGAAYKKTP